MRRFSFDHFRPFLTISDLECVAEAGNPDTLVYQSRINAEFYLETTIGGIIERVAFLFAVSTISDHF